MKKKELVITDRYNKAILPELRHEAKNTIESFRRMGILREPPKQQQAIDIVIQYDIDPIDETSINPTTEHIEVDNKHSKIYELIEDVLFNEKHELGRLDIFIFIFIVNRFSNLDKFETGTIFYESIVKKMISIGMSPNKKTIQNSIYKLARIEAIIKVGKNTYTVNSILAYSGHTETRNPAIKGQYRNKALYEYNLKNNK